MDIAFDLMSQKYPDMYANITRYTIYKPRTDSGSGCGDTGDLMYSTAGEAVNLMYRSKGFFILLSPGCSLEMIVLGDFARGNQSLTNLLSAPEELLARLAIIVPWPFTELNVPLLTSTAADAALANRLRYPTITTFSSAGQGQTSIAMREFLRRNSWKVITVLCDDLSLLASAATFYIVACRCFKTVLTENVGEFQIFYETFDSRYKPNYEPKLRRAKLQSRIILIGTNADIMRQIMIIAQGLNMTNGEYVFLYPQSLRVPQTSDLFWQQNDTYDEIAFNAYKSIITLEFPAPDWGKLTDFTQQVMERSQKYYNYTYKADEKENDIALSASEAIFALTQVLSETWAALDSMDGKTFSNKITNRSYDLGFRTVDIGNNGMRSRDTLFSKLNTTTAKFEATWFHTWKTNNISEISASPMQWYGQPQLPPDKPACGFTNELCTVKASWLPVIAGCLSGAFLAGYLFYISYRKWKWEHQHEAFISPKCWLLDPALLCVVHQNLDDSTLGLRQVLVNPLLEASNPLPRGSAANVVSAMIFYNGERAWVQSMPQETSNGKLTSSKSVKNHIAEMKILQHSNIGQLVGIVNRQLDVSLIWHFGRGTLRALLDKDELRLDNELRMSLVFELLGGLLYIHGSLLSIHGSLSSLHIIIDMRFSLKICAHGSTKLFSLLQKSAFRRKSEVPIDVTMLWMPPEIIAATVKDGTKCADVYSSAMVMCEILTGQTPLNVDLTNADSIANGLEQISSGSILRFDLSNHTFPTAIHVVLANCFRKDPEKRPPVSEILKSLKKFDGRRSILENVLSRMQNYSEELENSVSIRTQELMLEIAKVDTFLNEMIPSIFVPKLRNKELIPVDEHAMVTICLTSFVGFDIFSATSDPSAVIDWLNKVYINFDIILHSHDVYKIETIRDSTMIASGLSKRNRHIHASEVASAILEIVESEAANIVCSDHTKLVIRAGVHSGPCAAGTIGAGVPRYYLFGETINTAHLMEASGKGCKIHLSSSTNLLLFPLRRFDIRPRGFINLEGKGRVETFWLHRYR